MKYILINKLFSSTNIMDTLMIFGVIVLLVLFLSYKGAEQFAEPVVAEKVHKAVIVAVKGNLNLEEFKKLVNIPNFSSYTYMLMLDRAKKGELTKELVEKYLRGEFS